MSFLIPTIAHAAQITNIKVDPAAASIIQKVINILVVPAVELVFALALLLFIWGVFQYFVNSGDSTARKTGAQHLLWGVVGMFIMVSVYGIIRLVLTTLPF